jgi:hypothetical protein
MPIPYGRRLSLRNDKLQDVTPVRPEGDAQADLLHPTFYRVGEHAVTADRAEDESKQTEGGERCMLELCLVRASSTTSSRVRALSTGTSLLIWWTASV